MHNIKINFDKIPGVIKDIIGSEINEKGNYLRRGTMPEVDFGPVQINQEKNHTVISPAIPGGVILFWGIVIILLCKKPDCQ